VTRLTVYYDPRCGLCSSVRDWLGRQRQVMPIVCRPKPEAGEDLVVQADSGELWTGDSAWLIVLWALADYRHLANRLASPLLLPAARTLFAQISAHREAISCQLGLAPDVR
jgi:predicted DCC family thiol-disulfide oxidoreductase YuxK